MKSSSLHAQLTAAREAQKQQQVVAGFKAKNASLKATVAAMQRDIDELNRRFEAAMALRDPVRKIPLVVKASKSGSESVACAVLSDWHVEETVDPRTVNNLNRYSLAIADRRIAAITRNIVKLLENSRQGTSIETLVLALLGDFMTGYIHEELVESNSLSPVQTILWLKRRLVALLLHIEREAKRLGIKRIIIPCTVGNHGRTTQKPRIATATKNSYEWLLYRILEDEMPQFEWRVAEGQHVYLDIFDARWRLHHGDAIKYGGGVGGITIPVNKAISQWDKNSPADLDLFGHWHQFLAHRKFICNSSLIGYGAYALFIKAECEPPAQTFFLWEKEHGRTLTTPIFAD